jgi:hypothetical protein
MTVSARTAVSVIGAARRLQALAFVGHGVPTLARWCNVSPELVDAILHQTVTHIDQQLDMRITAMFDHRGNDDPLPRCMTLGDDPAIADYARDKRWASALAWDDIDMDDPRAVPNRGRAADSAYDDQLVELVLTGAVAAGGRLTIAGRRARDEAILRLAPKLSATAIGRRIGCTERTVHRVLADARAAQTQQVHDQDLQEEVLAG